MENENNFSLFDIVKSLVTKKDKFDFGTNYCEQHRKKYGICNNCESEIGCWKAEKIVILMYLFGAIEFKSLEQQKTMGEILLNKIKEILSKETMESCNEKI